MTSARAATIVGDHGAVVVGFDLFGDRSRQPFLLVSNPSHPFHIKECLAAVITTTERDRAVPLEGRHAEAELPERLFISP